MLICSQESHQITNLVLNESQIWIQIKSNSHMKFSQRDIKAWLVQSKPKRVFVFLTFCLK